MIAPNITFDNLPPDVHTCTSTREGDNLFLTENIVVLYDSTAV